LGLPIQCGEPDDKENDGVEGLILGRSRDVLVDGEMGQEGVDLRDAQGFRVALVVEDAEREAFGPVVVGVFGADGIIPQGDATRCLARMAAWRRSRSFAGGRSGGEISSD